MIAGTDCRASSECGRAGRLFRLVYVAALEFGELGQAQLDKLDSAPDGLDLRPIAGRVYAYRHFSCINGRVSGDWHVHDLAGPFDAICTEFRGECRRSGRFHPQLVQRYCDRSQADESGFDPGSGA